MLGSNLNCTGSMLVDLTHGRQSFHKNTVDKPKHSPESRGPDIFCTEAASDEHGCAFQLCTFWRRSAGSLFTASLYLARRCFKNTEPMSANETPRYPNIPRRYEDGLINLRGSQNCKSRGSQRHAGKTRFGIAHVEGHVLLAQRLKWMLNL